jgi:hypothetical protein
MTLVFAGALAMKTFGFFPVTVTAIIAALTVMIRIVR